MKKYYIGIKFENSFNISIDSFHKKINKIAEFMDNFFNKRKIDSDAIYYIFFPEYTFCGINKSYITKKQKDFILSELIKITKLHNFHNIIFIASTIPSGKDYFLLEDYKSKYEHNTSYLNNHLKSNNFISTDNLCASDDILSIHYKLKNKLYIISTNKFLNKPDNRCGVVGKYSKIAPHNEYLLSNIYNKNIFFQSGNTKDFNLNLSINSNKLTLFFFICADHSYKINQQFSNDYKFLDITSPNEVTFIFSDTVPININYLFTVLSIQMDAQSGMNIYLKKSFFNEREIFYKEPFLKNKMIKKKIYLESNGSFSNFFLFEIDTTNFNEKIPKIIFI